ncbi:MAG: hypothetical protein MSA85_08025, partial [Prevotella sp.]|nr:hypothetical protein [Prevotella sp.]
GEAFIHVYIVILIHSAKVLLLDNHVSFGNIVFGLASAQHSTGFVGCAFRSSCFSVIFENKTPRNPLAAVWRAVRITRAKVVRKSECNRNNTLSVRFITVALLNVVKKREWG